MKQWLQHSPIWAFNVLRRRILMNRWKNERKFELIHSEVNISTFLSCIIHSICYWHCCYWITEGFGHASQPSSIDLNAVRLCFQVFLKDPEGHNFNIPLEPVVSEPIYDKKAMSDLVICKLSKPSCNVAGGEEIILLCEKVELNKIQCHDDASSHASILLY